MSMADISIKRPIFIACIVAVMIIVGLMSMAKLPVDLNPNVNIPVIVVYSTYSGVAPSEMETLVTKPLEDQISTIAGIKRLTSKSAEGTSSIVMEFTLETDIKYAEQQVRDKVAQVKPLLPKGVNDPVVWRFDINEQPVLMLAVKANLPDTELYDLADDKIKRRFEQVEGVGNVSLSGGRKREIQVHLSREKLKSRDLSVTDVAQMLSSAGENVPSGIITKGGADILFRSHGEFKNLDDVKNTIVKLYGNEIPINVAKLGTVVDGMTDENSRAYLNGNKALLINVSRKSGANVTQVAKDLAKRINELNSELKGQKGSPEIVTILDLSTWIRDSVNDVKETIFLGLILTIIAVYFFLGNLRSTFITGLALPNSLIGAFILMSLAGFTINTITLLALSLTVGLLIDDAIVVRENIFRRMEAGESPIQAAKSGTKEVQLAVIATTLVVISVFAPIAFMEGIIGQFFKEFGLTVCFAMAISLFDALTIAPMLSAYFVAPSKAKKGWRIWECTFGAWAERFNLFQDRMIVAYKKILGFVLRRPILILSLAFVVFIASLGLTTVIKKTFVPEADVGYFGVSLRAAPETSLEAMSLKAKQVEKIIMAHPEVKLTSLTIGGSESTTHRASFMIVLKDRKERKLTTQILKEKVREELKPFTDLSPRVMEFANNDGDDRMPFTLDVKADTQADLDKAVEMILEKVRLQKGLTDIDSSQRQGKPEYQIKADPALAQTYGISTKSLGMELRGQVEGIDAAKFRVEGREYDVKVRLRDEERNLKDQFNSVYVPNINHSLIQLSKVASIEKSAGAASIGRQNRMRYASISAGIASDAGLGDVMSSAKKEIDKLKLPPNTKYSFSGESEDFSEMMVSMFKAFGLCLLFIYVVLASLYESLIVPFTIMLALPLAICGALLALFVTGKTIDIYSMIGVILLLGVACKNSILLVDCTRQLMEEGLERTEAIIEAGGRRFRPIMMTSMALIVGMMPVALGFTEISKIRSSMGVAIVGGIMSSTLLTLIVIPAAFSFVDRFRLWSKEKVARLFY